MTKVEVAPPRSLSDIAEIEGIDLKDGLKRVAGNARLYRDMLLKFAAKYGEAGVQVSAALQSEDRQLAERIAHTVKGVAGNLGIKRVQLAAEKLEKAIPGRDPAVSSSLGDFTSLLRSQIEAIEQALGTSTTTAGKSDSRTSFDPVAASREVARLRSLLEASDGDSEETFRTVENILAGAVEKERLDALGADISEFDFAGALLKLDGIVKEHSLNREEAK